MYKFDEFFNSYGFDKKRLENALKHNLLEPFSRLLAYHALQLIDSEEYENYTTEFLLEGLKERYRIYSGKFSTLNFGQALSLYFSLEMSNFSEELTKPFLEGSNIKLSKWYVVYTEPVKLKQWMKTRQIKFIPFDDYNSDNYYNGLFFYSQTAPPEEFQKDAIWIKLIKTLKDLTSQVGTSQGLIKANTDTYDRAMELLKYFPGWSLLREDNNLYTDYCLTQSVTGDETYGAYLISDISREYIEEDQMSNLYTFLKGRGLGKYCSKVPNKSTSIKKTATLIIASWDTFWYKEPGLPEELQEAIKIFFSGLGMAHSNARFGYLAFIFSLDDEIPKLYNVTYTNMHLNKEWEVNHCIKPALEKSDCRLVLWEHTPSQIVFDQFKELVQTPIIMQFVGAGVTWSDEKINETQIQAYKDDPFDQNYERAYYNWFLLDNNNNLLVYVSIFLKHDIYQVRIIARVHGYARKALILAIKEFSCRVPTMSLVAKVDVNNKASAALFDSMYPSWLREANPKGGMITYTHTFE